jgi:transcriptional regulatory protein RtcR
MTRRETRARSGKRHVALGFLGTTLDAVKHARRFERWRPTIALAMHEELALDRLELLVTNAEEDLVELVLADLKEVAPRLDVRTHALELADPWDFEEVFARLFDFARSHPFELEREEYLVHLTTGSHVAQICWFLLTESRHVPARLVQTAPGREVGDKARGRVSIVDLDLARYDALAARFRTERVRGQELLKGGVVTRNAAFNAMIAEIEAVALASRAPILLTGPTGAGKSQLARRIFELKKARHLVKGTLVDVNCATLRGDLARSTLFGHKKGAFTGAIADRRGLLEEAHEGVLFLDEIGELGLEEQAMLLVAIEEKRFVPVGASREVKSDFTLLAGTNRDLAAAVREGRFREDLLARIDLWSFALPPLRDRIEDLEPNLDFELERAARVLGRQVTMNRDARRAFLRFGAGHSWPANFRDLAGAVLRMATLAEGGRIAERDVDKEIAARTRSAAATPNTGHVARVLGARASSLDRFDRVQLEDVLAVCAEASSLSDAGRTLFSESRKTKSSTNDADRLRKYLARFALDWASVRKG